MISGKLFGIGIGIGTAIGVASEDVALSLAFGVVLGILMDSVRILRNRRKEISSNLPEEN